MSNNIFRNVANGRSVKVNLERLKGLGQNIIKKHDDETQEDIKDTQPETQTVSSEQVQALLGINRKEEYEITTTLKTMILQRRITSGLLKSKITPYEDYKDAKGDQKIGFKTKSINHIINVYNLKKWKGKTLDIESIISNFIENRILSKKNGKLDDKEIKELQSIKDTILRKIKEIETTKKAQQPVEQDTNAVAEGVEVAKTESIEVEQMTSQQPMEQPVKPTAQPEMKKVETQEEKHEVTEPIEESQATQSQPVVPNTNTATKGVEVAKSNSNEVDEVKQMTSQQPIEQPVEPTAQPEMKQVETPEEKPKVTEAIEEVKATQEQQPVEPTANTTAENVEVKDVITIERPKTRFSKAISIDIPNTTNPKTSVVYTYAQYTIPEGLKVKPLGVQSLAKHKDSFNMDTLVCLNISSDHPLYAMELKDSVELKKVGTLKSGETEFATAKLFGQNRLIYRMADRFGNIKNYVVLDQSIAEKYATNQYAQEKICCENEREIQLGQVLSPLTLTLTPTPTQTPTQTPTATAIAKTEKALCEQIRALTPAVFKGTILPQDSQKLLKLLGLDINQTFQTNENGEILTKDGVKTGVGSNFDNNGKLVNFCTLNRGNDEKLPVLRNLKNSLCNLDISGSLQSDEKTRRSRFIIEIKNGCFYLKSENDFIYINMPVYLGADGMFDNFGEAQQCNLRYDSQNQYKPKTPDEQAPKTVTISTTNEYKQAYKQAFITNTLSYERTHFECRSFKDDTSELVENSIRTFKSLTHNLADKEKIRCQFKLMKNYYVNNNYKAQTDPEGLLDKCFWLYTYNQYKKDKPYDNEAKQNLARMQQNPSYYITNLNNKFDAAYASNNIDEMLKIAKELIEYYQHALEIMQSLSPEVSSNVANSYQQIKEQTNLPKE